MGLERSGDVVPTESVGQPGNGEEPARAVKPFGIAKRVVWEAYRHVKPTGARRASMAKA